MDPGDVLSGRFEIERRAGLGGMGEVFRARDRALGDSVAVKVLLDGQTSDRRRFTREAEVLAELCHPGIVRYVAHGFSSGGQPYLAMEWLEGEDLARRLRRSVLSVDEAVLLGTRVAEALAAAHARGIVHRDLKPNNLFLVGHDIGRVKVLDFGIAQLGDATTMTKTGIVLGTPGYIAPEQARSGQEIDARADVFALGCVLFKALTGTPVFSGDHLVIVLAKILFEEAPRVRDLRPDVPPALDALIAQMLAKERDERPPNCAAVAAALKALGTMVPQLDEPPISVSVPSSALTGSERRVLSVVLLGPGSRPSNITELTRAESDVALADGTLRETVEAHGGQLEPTTSGSTLVLIPNPMHVATDQAAQAARCALALRAAAGSRPMALATGRVEMNGKQLEGDAIERAEQILSTITPADPSSRERGSGLQLIAIDDVTAGLLDARFDVVEAPWGFALRGEREISTGMRTLLGKPTSCVGRDAELATLEALWTECIEEPVARVVLITALPGIGKSRLAHELIRRIQQRDEPSSVWIGRSDSLRAGSAFAVLGHALRSALGIQDGEPLETRRNKLSARVAEHVPESDQARVTEFLGELVGTPFPDDGSTMLQAARQDAQLMGDQVQRAAVSFLRAESGANPVLLVLEDLHWGDLPTVRIIDRALRDLSDKAWMVLALARPEVHEIFPRLWADRDVQEVRLKGLTRKASERLVRQALGNRVSPQTIERLVQQAEGHAFYLEELIRSVAEGKGDTLPETVLAMVEARLTRLEPEARRILRAASIFGEVCWLGGVAELLGGPAMASPSAEWFALLSEREVLICRPESRFPDEPEYAFRHALLREGAYATLTDDDRMLGHRLAGEWLLQRGESDSIMLAEHFERGHEPARAARFFMRAAEDALRAGDLDTALSHAQRGLAGEVDESVRIELLGSLCAIYAWRNEPGLGMNQAKEVLRDAAPLSVPWSRALTLMFLPTPVPQEPAEIVSTVQKFYDVEPSPEHLASFIFVLANATIFLDLIGRFDLSAALIERKVALVFPMTEKKPVVQRPLHISGSLRAALVKEDPWLGLETARLAEASVEEADLWHAEAFTRMLLGMHAWYLGALTEAENQLRSRSIARDNLGAVSSYRLFCLAGVLADRGALEEACLVARLLIEDGKSRSSPTDRAHGQWALANALLRLGDLDAALIEVQKALETLPFLPLDHLAATATLARILLGQGHAREALAAAEDAMHRYRTTRACGFFRGATVRLVYAEALHLAGDADRAREAITQAREHLLAIAAKISDPVYKKSFLEAVPDNAQTFALAQSWAGLPIPSTPKAAPDS